MTSSCKCQESECCQCSQLSPTLVQGNGCSFSLFLTSLFMGRYLRVAVVTWLVSVGTDKSGGIKMLLTHKICFFISPFQEHPATPGLPVRNVPKSKWSQLPTQHNTSIHFISATHLLSPSVEFNEGATFMQCAAAWNCVSLIRESSELQADWSTLWARPKRYGLLTASFPFLLESTLVPPCT